MTSIYEDRLTAVRDKFSEWEIEALLITSEANRRWLSGFTGSNGQLLVTPTQALLATDSRYFEQATVEAPAFELFAHRRTPADDKILIKQGAARRIGLEANQITLDDYRSWQALGLDVEWIALTKTIEQLRLVKDAGEREVMARAAKIADLALSQFPEMVRPGMSEREAAWMLERIMRDAGADGVAFPIIVASGSNSALPHHGPTERLFVEGETILVDLGARLGGYHSDITRTFHLGDAPSDQFWSVYHAVLAAQTNVFDELRPGMNCIEADALARNSITAAGFGKQFGHGLGHGVGLEIHEDPFMSPRASTDILLAAGMNLTVEPGIYLPGWGGVRIEDFANVTEAGLERISHCPKTPVIRV